MNKLKNIAPPFQTFITYAAFIYKSLERRGNINE